MNSVNLNHPIEFSVVMPCLNEEKTLTICINKARCFFENAKIPYEIIIADNGSTDNSIQIIQNLSVRLIQVKKKGYGSTLKEGIKAATGKYIIMGDSDDSYDFSDLNGFVHALRGDHDLVMGNRFKGGILPDAMPWLHKYIGNPGLSFVGRVLFRTKVGDFHCGLRGFSIDAYDRIAPVSDGMEFATELVAKASLHEMRISEVPVVLYHDGRDRKPHLRTWSDGFAHLRLMIVLFIKSHYK